MLADTILLPTPSSSGIHTDESSHTEEAFFYEKLYEKKLMKGKGQRTPPPPPYSLSYLGPILYFSQNSEKINCFNHGSFLCPFREIKARRKYILKKNGHSGNEEKLIMNGLYSGLRAFFTFPNIELVV